MSARKPLQSITLLLTALRLREFSLVNYKLPITDGVVTWTHWGRVTHICVGNLTIIVSESGFSTGRHQTIIWTNDGFCIRSLGANSIKFSSNSYICIHQNACENGVCKSYDVSAMAIIFGTGHQHTRARLGFNIHIRGHHQLATTVAIFVLFS